MKKIYLILLAVMSLAFTSCLMEEKEIFDKTPAERMDAYLEEYRSILSSNEEGWLLQYYAEEEQSYGGYAYVLKFTQDDVTAWFQLADDVTKSITTLYKMTPDDGPVLAFDTYNEYLHYFATPNVSDYEALHGDYEFRLVGKNDDASEIYLKGRRSGNALKLVKFTGDPATYLAACNAVQAGMKAPAYKMTIGEIEGECSLSNNRFEYAYTVVVGQAPVEGEVPAEGEVPEEGEGEVVEPITETFEGATAFCYTPDGVDFYTPVVIDGVTYNSLVYNAENGTLSTEDGKVVISQVIPPLNQMLVLQDWYITYSNVGAFGKPYMDVVKQSLEGIGEQLLVAYLGSSLFGKWGLNFYTTTGAANYKGGLYMAYQL